ncbi:protein SENESCENCE-ASSOCIATED GENE 21, mitochondrial-like [Salvia miltiorrhiza]|uniref:protein SENESCENCE-ASSOCIATED GENE 21, mitochondrial-like n=1 Tax=Salvia miltiorrhiza TaxID=226208 RepID=UPI0025ABFCB0|nr:protein SENESCENCE-ASSOCIATED GENE 21, mitochondrial-like [Salvia miltiorrhiza]
MARSFSNVKTVSSFIGNQISAAVTRRGYSAASQSQGLGSTSRAAGAPNMMLKKGSEKAGESAWVPDPVTGCYRPESNAKEMDPVELRKMLIRSKNRAK